MANVNKVMLLGNLTRDPKLSYTPNQTAVVDFTLAINRNWTGKDNEKRSETCFTDCVAYSKKAETISKYVKKGNPFWVEGRLKYESWEDKESGAKRSRLKVLVEEFQFINERQQQPQPTDETTVPSPNNDPF